MSRSIKILYPISIYFPSQVGGPSNSIYWMCQGLKNSSSIKTAVIASDMGLDLNQIQLNKWYLDENNRAVYINAGKFHIKLILKTIRYIKDYDIVHLNSLFYFPSIIIAFITRLFSKKKIVVSVRGELDDYALTIGKRKLKKIFLWFWSCLKNRITFHCTVKEEKDYTEKVFGKKSKIIQLPNYILKPKINISLEKHYDKNYLLYLGRIHEKKGIENLLQALAKSDTFISSKTILKIAGQGDFDYVKKLKQLAIDLGIKNKVEFLGQIEGEKKEVTISQAYFLIMPSHTENFGNVVVESLIHGTPVIASKGTPWEILEKTNSGFWVSNSVKSLTTILDHILNIDETEYRNLSQNAIKLIDKEFDIQNNYIKWETFYSELAII